MFKNNFELPNLDKKYNKNETEKPIEKFNKNKSKIENLVDDLRKKGLNESDIATAVSWYIMAQKFEQHKAEKEKRILYSVLSNDIQQFYNKSMLTKEEKDFLLEELNRTEGQDNWQTYAILKTMLDMVRERQKNIA